jgi:signal transduction histidine kinase
MYRMRRPTGEQVDLSVTAAPVREEPEGQVKLAVLVLRDITELRRLERMRDEFLSIAAHELKTPVSTIKGYTQLLERWAPGGHEPREGSAFRVLNRQCDRLNLLVQDLLEVSRLQLGRLELHPQRFQLGALVQEVGERMQALTERHRLVLDLDGEAWVDADRDRIDQVLVNLIDNAIKFSPEGGDVRIQLSRQGGEAVVSVKDSGIGVPWERQPQLSERFYRAHAGLTSDRGGMGIGLYLSRQILLRHGGRLDFESEEGKGSTVSFRLALVSGGRDARA